MKKSTFIALAILGWHTYVPAQNLAAPNCGVNSAVSLARSFGSSEEARAELQAKYPTAAVSLLDVKQMCQRLGVETSGVKAKFSELVQSRTSCIIGLKEPEHFLVLLDGTANEVRVLDGEMATLQVIPRREIESRFTGFALVPDVKAEANSPKLEMPKLDQYLVFNGVGQKVEFRFSLKNGGKSPLSVEVSGTSCGCTAAILAGDGGKKMMLAPGQSSEVVVSYEVQTEAQVQQTVTLKTNDPRRREVYLSVRGQLPPQLAISPPRLFVQQKKGEEPNKIFKLIGPVGTEVTRVWSDLPYLKFTMAPKEEEAVQVKLPIAVRGFAEAPVGTINGTVFVRLREGKELTLTVRGEIE